jgi:hypothetical protein
LDNSTVEALQFIGQNIDALKNLLNNTNPNPPQNATIVPSPEMFEQSNDWSSVFNHAYDFNQQKQSLGY